MNDKAQHHHHGGAIKTVGGFLLFIALIVYVLQVYLNKPENRPIVACWVPYQVARLALVEVPKIVLVRDHDIPLANAYRVARFNQGCICTMSHWDLLTDHRQPHLPFTCQ